MTLLVIRIGLLSVFTAMLGAGVLYVSLFTMDVSEGVNPVVVAGIIFTGVGAFLALLAAALDVGRIIVYGH